MFHALKEQGHTKNVSYVQPAVINKISESNLCHVEYTLNGMARESWAMLAVPAYQPVVGDRVLVTGECIDECYIIGVLASSPSPFAKDALTKDAVANKILPKVAVSKNTLSLKLPQQTQVLSTQHGAVARVTHKNNKECLQIEDERGQLIFEYRPEQGAGMLSMPEGDLALHAPKGNIQLVSGKSVVCSSTAPVVIESASGIDMRVKTQDTNATVMQLTKRALTFRSERLGLNTKKADVKINTMNYQGSIINGTVERAKWVCQKLETIVDRLFERARNVYRQTEELNQTKAGRMRTLVDGDYYLKGNGVDVRAEETAKIDGKKIHLG